MKTRSILLILGIGLLLRIFMLDSESLWLDEGASVKYARLKIGEIFEATKSDANPPLYYYVLHLWIRIFGDSEFSLRFPSVIFGVLAVLLLYKFCIEFWNKEVAFFSSLIVAMSAFHVFYSQEARMYALLSLLSLLSFFYFAKILRKQDLKNFVFYSIVNVLLLYTHPYSFFIIFAQFVFLIIYERDKVGKFFASYAISFLFFLPRFFIVLRQFDEILVSGEFWLPRPSLIDIAKTLVQFAGATYPMPRDENDNVIWSRFILEYLSSSILLLIFLLMIVFSIFSFRGFAGERKRFYIILWFWFAIPILIPFVLSQFLTPFYFTRYAIASSIPFYCLSSIGVESLGKNLRIKRYLYIVTSLLLVVNLGWYYAKTNKEEWREAVRFIERRVNSRDLVIANKDVFYYYWRRDEVDRINLTDCHHCNVEDLAKNLYALGRNYDRIWYVSSHEPELRKNLVKILSNFMTLSLRKKFLGVEVFLFENAKK